MFITLRIDWLHVPGWFPVVSGSTLGLQNKIFSNFVHLFQLGWSQETFHYLWGWFLCCVLVGSQNLQKLFLILKLGRKIGHPPVVFSSQMTQNLEDSGVYRMWDNRRVKLCVSCWVLEVCTQLSAVLVWEYFQVVYMQCFGLLWCYRKQLSFNIKTFQGFYFQSSIKYIHILDLLWRGRV